MEGEGKEKGPVVNTPGCAGVKADPEKVTTIPKTPVDRQVFFRFFFCGRNWPWLAP